jgi:hypothetical protein
MTNWALFLLRVVRDELRDRAGVYRLGAPYRTRYLSQPGLALSCDAFGGLPYVMLRTDHRPELLNLDAYAAIRHGERVWLRIEDLDRFVRGVLPRLREPFVMITGDSDYTVPSDFPDAARQLVESGLVQRWFSTNYDGSAHRELITGLPLGLNYARKNELIGALQRQGPLRVEMKPLHQQEDEWDAIAAAASPLEQRLPRAVADFYLRDSSRNRKYGESRSDIARQLAGNSHVTWVERRRPLAGLFAVYARHAFVISPHGNALDCYRTWEALLMGCVPIVKRSPIDYLYTDLPVAIVDEWSEITALNLQRWLERFGEAFNRQPLRQTLSSQFWQARIRNCQDS